MKPLPPRAATLLGALAFLAIIGMVRVSGSWRGDFRIDEAHKISETAFLRIWLDGDVRNPAWFGNIVDRMTPPAGKYAFGAAILLRRQTLPSLPTLAVRDPNIPALHATELSAPYRPLLHTVRAVSTVATALTAAILTTLMARYHGWISAAFAFTFFSMSYVTQTYWATAVYDPLLALFIMMAIALMTALAAGPATKRVVVLAVAMGIVTALAFQTRLNGLYAFLVVIPFLWIVLRRSIRMALLATVVTAGGFVVTTLTLNPYYRSTPAIPHEPFSSHNGPLRPVQRLIQQKQDLVTVAAPVITKRTAGRTPGEKAGFVFEGIASDLPGLLMMFAAVAAVTLLALRWRSLTPAVRVALSMSLAFVLTMVGSLPMPWLRYLLVDVAPLALLAGFASAELASALVREVRIAAAAARR